MRILAVGPLWRGSNAGALFRALSREGCLLEVVDEFYSISLQTKNKATKLFERLIRPLQEKNFNDLIVDKVKIFNPDILLVYKGVFVTPETLIIAKKNNCKLVLFYPDVSMTTHGGNIPKCIPEYDIIFTTKTFGITDMEKIFGVKNAIFIPHGFDPEIHKKLEISERDKKYFGCDVSFIGTWSPKKEKLLSYLKQQSEEISLKIWGSQWDKSTSQNLKTSVQGMPVTGDLYALAIQSSKINLGILSEQISGASSGDLITSRTFHIPGASGFLLHERNKESTLYFKEDEEAGFFDGPEELVKKVSLFLRDISLREKITSAGHQRALKDHTLDKRAQVILNQINIDK